MAYAIPVRNDNRRHTAVVLGGLLILLLLSWGYTVRMAAHHGMSLDSAIANPAGFGWQVQDVVAAVTMWVIMMAAMMLPSVLPWLTVLLRVLPRQTSSTQPLASAAGFLLGYLAVWVWYSVAAAGAQWLLHEKALLSSQLTTTSPFLAAGVLILSGLYQLTPAKDACLSHCRSPLGFLLTSWKPARWATFRLGFQHGLYCVGCCWALMALSFVAGVMNLLWMILITTFIFIDHNLPAGRWLSRTTGVVLVSWGLWLVLGRV